MNVSVKFLSHIPSHELVIFRSVISFVICFITLKRLQISPWGNHKPFLILRGLFGTGALLLYFYTIQYMPLASAVTIQYLSPIFTVILASFILKEYARPLQWACFLISFLGVWLIKGVDDRISLDILGIGILAAFGSGLAYNMVRKLKDFDHPLVVIFYFPLISIPVIGPYTAMNYTSPKAIDWLWIVVLGIFTQLGQYYMTKAYQAEEFSKISNFNYLGVIFAMSYGWMFFDETIPLLSIGGMGLIVFGVILSTRFKKQADV